MSTNNEVFGKISGDVEKELFLQAQAETTRKRHVEEIVKAFQAHPDLLVVMRDCSIGGKLSPSKFVSHIKGILPKDYEEAIDQASENTTDEQIAKLAQSVVREAIAINANVKIADDGISGELLTRPVVAAYRGGQKQRLQDAGIPFSIEKAGTDEKRSLLLTMLSRALNK